MRDLLSKLNSAGIRPAFAKRALPSWWDDQIAADPAGLQQARLYFARAFNIDIKSLTAGDEACFRVTQRKFKLNRNVLEDSVLVSANYVTGIARVALHGSSFEQVLPCTDPLQLRNTILQRHKCVNLEALLEWCVSAGIPVLHVENLPGKKMSGIVVRDDDKYAIVLCKKGHPSLLLFYLAHELGHIAMGHLSSDGVFADAKIGGADTDANADEKEKEADRYAIRLLNGKIEQYQAGRNVRTAMALAQAAVVSGTQNRVDPGHIIANYCHGQELYGLLNSALGMLDGPKQGGPIINGAFFQSIEESFLSDDQLELLKTATATA